MLNKNYFNIKYIYYLILYSVNFNNILCTLTYNSMFQVTKNKLTKLIVQNNENAGGNR